MHVGSGMWHCTQKGVAPHKNDTNWAYRLCARKGNPIACHRFAYPASWLSGAQGGSHRFASIPVTKGYMP